MAETRMDRAPYTELRTLPAGFFVDITHDCKLMHEASLKLAIWLFCGFGLTERLTDHSSLTCIRQRWGAERLRAILSAASVTVSKPRLPLTGTLKTIGRYRPLSRCPPICRAQDHHCLAQSQAKHQKARLPTALFGYHTVLI